MQALHHVTHHLEKVKLVDLAHQKRVARKKVNQKKAHPQRRAVPKRARQVKQRKVNFAVEHHGMVLVFMENSRQMVKDSTCMQ